MKLTIISSDKTVGVDRLFFSGLDLDACAIPDNVHALQWINAAGWIEYNDGHLNEDITALPQWALNAKAVWDSANIPIPPPTPEQIQAQNEKTAIELLDSTDWATIPDVSNPSLSNPYLVNSAAFIAFRNQVRPIAINPPTTPVTFTTAPKPEWASV